MARGQDLETDGARLGGAERERYVEHLFDRIASPYDRLNRLISLGRDRGWRRRLVALSGCGAGARICDVGTGTGDLALAFLEQVGESGVVLGCDIAQQMLEQAVVKRDAAGRANLGLVRAPAAALPLERGWADVVCMGWVLRNLGDRPAYYSEVLRVLRPGGVFLSIDMSHPEGLLRRAGFWTYRHLVMPPLVRAFGGDREAYRYLARSTDRFPRPSAIDDELVHAGFRDVSHEALMGGSIAIHAARAP